MMSVTDLSREIVSEIQTLTGCPISVDDYLRIRSVAVSEIEKGMYKRTTFEVPATEPAMTTETPKPEIVIAHTPTGPTSAQVKAIPKAVPKEVTKKPTQRTKAPAASSEDPFFAMCDKL